MRNLIIDISKGIGIIFVVIGHTNSKLHDFIYLFHMPLFFFLSGYTYNEIYSDKPIEYIKKKIKSLYIPFISIQLVYLFFNNIFIKINILNSGAIDGKIFEVLNLKNIIKKIIQIISFGMSEQLAGPLWFLYSLFFTSLLFLGVSYICRYIKKKNREYVRALIIIILFILGCISAMYDVYIPRNLDVSLVAILFFYLGYIYKLLNRELVANKKKIIACALVLFLSSTYGTLEFGSNEIINPIFLIVNSIMGIYFVLILSKYIEKTLLCKVIKYIGENTMIILAYHLLAFKLVSYLIIVVKKLPKEYLASFPYIDKNGGWWILYTIIGIIVPLMLKNVFVKFKKNMKRCKNEGDYFSWRIRNKIISSNKSYVETDDSDLR